MINPYCKKCTITNTHIYLCGECQERHDRVKLMKVRDLFNKPPLKGWRMVYNPVSGEMIEDLQVFIMAASIAECFISKCKKWLFCEPSEEYKAKVDRIFKQELRKLKSRRNG